MFKKNINILMASLLLLSACDDNSTQSSSNRSISSNSKIDYTFNEMYPYITGLCEGFGCVLADLTRPGGRKRISDKYDGKNILITKYAMTSYNDNYDSITYYDIENLLPCKMSLEESAKLEKATNGKKGAISIYGTLHIGMTSPYIEPCYFKGLYQCKGDEVGGALCLKDETKNTNANSSRKKYIKSIK